jgi:hypothetical protein
MTTVVTRGRSPDESLGTHTSTHSSYTVLQAYREEYWLQITMCIGHCMNTCMDKCVTRLRSSDISATQSVDPLAAPFDAPGDVVRQYNFVDRPYLCGNQLSLGRSCLCSSVPSAMHKVSIEISSSIKHVMEGSIIFYNTILSL